MNEDNTNLCFVDRSIFTTSVSELEIEKLMNDEIAYVDYPRDEDMKVRVAAKKQVRKLKSGTMLDALNFSGNPHLQ